MTPNLNQTNVDESDPNLESLFSDLQANILKGHGRDQSINVFLRFTSGTGASRTWLKSMAEHVTSAAQQYQDARDYAASGEERLLTTLLLSAEGYRALGFAEDEIPEDKAFRAGMRDLDIAYDTAPRGDHKPVANPLNDAPETWEEPFLQGIHALVILAYGGDHRHAEAVAEAHRIMTDKLAKMTRGLDGIAEVVLHQEGHALRNDKDQVIEHFGYVDGVTNPRFFKGDIDNDRNNGGFDRYDPSAPLSLVLAPDPLGAKDAHGSYFVFRKLQQNVKGFTELKGELADALTKDSGEEISPGRAGALIVGRFKDGTPVCEQWNDGWTSLPTNYDYSSDIEARRCPFQSHARKTNPRDDTMRQFGSPPTIERSRRIVRRAISYGSTELMPDSNWADQGLLFLCCQNNIEHQFIFMQHTWCNNENFLEPGTGIDPLVGQLLPEQTPVPQKWSTHWGFRGQDTEFGVADVVRMRGGEYFFAPSLSFFASL